MKHDVVSTMKLFGWFLLSLFFAGMLANVVLSDTATLPSSATPVVVVGFVVAAVLLGALFWFVMLRTGQESLVRTNMCFLVGVVAAQLFRVLFPGVWVVWALVVALGVGYGVWALSEDMRRSWRFTQQYAWMLNGLFALLFAFVGLRLGGLLSPVGVFVVLGLLSLYDLIAVVYTRHMVVFAQSFVEARVFPGIFVPKRRRGDVALFGGGDVVLVVAVWASLLQTAVGMAMLGLAGMVLAIALLLAFSKRGVSYPGLPFIFIGASVGVLSYMVYAWL